MALTGKERYKTTVHSAQDKGVTCKKKKKTLRVIKLIPYKRMEMTTYLWEEITIWQWILKKKTTYRKENS